MNAVGDLNLWAIGYPTPARAREVRAELLREENVHGLRVLDAVVVVRLPDGSFEITRDEHPGVSTDALGSGFLGLLVGLIVLQPVAAAGLAAAVGGITSWTARRFGVRDDFLGDLEALVAPGTSALFLLTRTDNPDAVLYSIRGLGGTVLKTNVNADLARQVQDGLDAARTDG